LLSQKDNLGGLSVDFGGMRPLKRGRSFDIARPRNSEKLVGIPE